MIEQDVIKAYKMLKRNKLNPSLFFVDENKTVSDAYYEIINDKKRKEPRGKYVIYCHKHRQEGIDYVEDLFSQSDYSKLNAKQIEVLFKKHKLKLYCCYDCFINRVGTIIAESGLNYKDFDVVYYDEGKTYHAIVTRDGYLTNWPIGYFTFD